FFVISGFLIGDMLLSELERSGRLNFRSFYVRRWFRLAPAYYLVLIGFAVFHRIDPSHYSLDRLWTNFIYVNNWFPLRGQPAVWTWSLAVEEQFYLLCPLLLSVLWRAQRTTVLVIGGAIVLSIAWNYWKARTAGPFRLTYHSDHDPEAFFAFFDHSYAQTL